MTKINRQHRMRLAIAAMALALPSVVVASIPPIEVAKQGAKPETSMPETASWEHRFASAKGALLRGVSDVVAEGRDKEASPFEPPGKPPDRPPGNPGHDDPPNPPGKPPDRPPNP